jgi:TatA/E family protein of Tat protein translocase
MSVGPPEILVILIVALLVFGPQRLPEVGRQVGAAVRELRRMQDTVRGELDMVLHPEHGTSPSNAPVADEPGDHTAIGSGDVSSVEVTPEEHTTGDVTSREVPPDASDANASDEDRRFLGPPDSFI